MFTGVTEIDHGKEFSQRRSEIPVGSEKTMRMKSIFRVEPSFDHVTGDDTRIDRIRIPIENRANDRRPVETNRTKRSKRRFSSIDLLENEFVLNDFHLDDLKTSEDFTSSREAQADEDKRTEFSLFSTRTRPSAFFFITDISD